MRLYENLFATLFIVTNLKKQFDKIKKSGIHYIMQGAKNNFVSFARWQRKHIMTNFYERRIPSMRKTVLSS